MRTFLAYAVFASKNRYTECVLTALGLTVKNFTASVAVSGLVMVLTGKGYLKAYSGSLLCFGHGGMMFMAEKLPAAGFEFFARTAKTGLFHAR